MVRRIELHEEVEDFVHDPVAARRGLVYLVYYHNNGKRQSQRLLQHKIGLGHGAFGRVDEQQYSVRHLEDPLDLPAEIGVAGGVDDVDEEVLVPERTVLRRDGNAPLPLQVHGIHEPFLHHLVVAEHAALREKPVDKGRLPVIDMRYDCNITYLFLFQRRLFLNCKAMNNV